MKAHALALAALLAAAMALLAFAPQPSAGAQAQTVSSTVTLSGYCSKAPYNSTVDFHLLNSGNGTASTLSIEPFAEGISFQKQNQSLALLGPGGNVSMEFNISSYKYPGSYAVGFVAWYSQQGLSVSASFPCIISIGSPLPSLVQLGPFNYSRGGMHAQFYNLQAQPVNVTVFTITSPNIYVRGSPTSAVIPAGGEHNWTFNVTVYQPAGITAASYSAAVALQYISSGVSHATFGSLVIPAGSKRVSQGSPIVDYALYAAIVVIVVLIAASVVLRRRSRAVKNAVDRR